MKVDHPFGRFDRDPRGKEIGPDHLSRPARKAKDRLSWRKRREPDGELRGERRREWLNGLLAVLRIGRLDRHGRRVRSKVEIRWGQGPEFAGTKTGRQGNDVEPRAIRTSHLPGVLACRRGLDEPNPLLGRQRSPNAAPVLLGVPRREMLENMLPSSTIAPKPARERLNRPDVMVDGLDAPLFALAFLGPELAQRDLNPRKGELADPVDSGEVENAGGSLLGPLRMLGSPALGLQRAAKVDEMLTERSLGVLAILDVARIDEVLADRPLLGLDLSGHQLRLALVATTGPFRTSPIRDSASWFLSIARRSWRGWGLKRRATAGSFARCQPHQGSQPTMTHHMQTTAFNEIGQLLADQGFDGLADALRVLLNEVMKIERAAVLGAGPYQRAKGRTGYANGFKPKTVQTRVGSLTRAVPQTRDVEFDPSALEKGVRSERALKLALAEMDVQGVSTRKVAAITEQLCGLEVTSAQVSRAAQTLDEELKKWRTRPLGETPYLILDARYEKVRHGGSVRSCAVLVAQGIDPDGKRSVLGVSVSLSEAEVHWRT